MAKAKTLKQQEVSLVNDMPVVKLKKSVKIKKHDPTKNLSDPEFITQALAECLLDGDKESFIAILNSCYGAVNKTEKLKELNVKQRTFYDALNMDGNPTLETILKLTSGLKTG